MKSNLTQRWTLALRAVASLGVLLAASMACAQATSQATKNGYPCISGVCLGDGLEDLKKHPIEPDRFPEKVGKLRPIEKTMLWDAEEAIGRMKILGVDKDKLTYAEKMRLGQGGVMSKQGLDVFQRITHSCNGPLQGSVTWKLPDGGTVNVKVELLRVPKDAERHTWMVTKISRAIPQLTEREIFDWFATLEKRWADVLSPSSYPDYVPWYEREFGKGNHSDRLERSGKSSESFRITAAKSLSSLVLEVTDPNRTWPDRNASTPACATLRPKLD